MDPHIFADPDPGSLNLADPTDPNPKHWLKLGHCYLSIEGHLEDNIPHIQ